MLINIVFYILSVFFAWWSMTTISKLAKVQFRTTGQAFLYNAITLAMVAIAVGLIVLAVII